MPCSDGDYDQEVDRARRVEAEQAACNMRTVLRNHRLEHKLNALTRDWIRRHDKEDAVRLKREDEEKEMNKLRAKAIGKLTIEEWEALKWKL